MEGETVGRLGFCVACAGTASGTRNSIPDSASSASIVPELNLLKYIEDVFIFSEQVARNHYIKRVDELSIIRAVLGQKEAFSGSKTLLRLEYP